MKTNNLERKIEVLTRELERVEIWLSQHLMKNIETKPVVMEIPTAEVVDIYRLLSNALENL